MLSVVFKWQVAEYTSAVPCKCLHLLHDGIPFTDKQSGDTACRFGGLAMKLVLKVQEWKAGERKQTSEFSGGQSAAKPG